MENKFGDLSGYKTLSFEEATKGFTGNKNLFHGIASNSFEEISFDKKNGEAGEVDKCAETKGDFYSANMDLNTLLNALSNRTNESFFFYYQNYSLSNPSTIGGISPTVLTSTSTTYTPSKYFEYTRGNEEKLAELSVELNKRACFISLKEYGSQFYLNPEKEEMLFELKFVYTDYLDKRDFNDVTCKYELEKKYNAVIISTSDANGYVALSEKLNLRNHAKNEIITLFTEKVKEAKDPAALKFLYENMPDFVIDQLLNRLEKSIGATEVVVSKSKKQKPKIQGPALDFLWKHIELLSDYDDIGFFSWTKDSSGALLNLLKTFRSSSFLFESFKSNQTMVKRIFNNMNHTSVVDGREWSNKTLFANFITALCIDNAFEGLRILDKEFSIGNDYAISSGSMFQEEKDNEFFLKQMQNVTRMKTETIVDEKYWETFTYPETRLEDAEKGNLYHPMDIVRIKYADIKEAPFPFVSAMTIKAYAEERDQQLRADAVRIGFDVLAIVLGVVFFPAGGAIGIIAESVGIGLAFADIGITASREEILQEEGGKEFLETWNKVYFVGGLTLASVAIVEQVFAKSVFSYLNALKKSSPLLEAYEKSLGKILLEREILTFAGNTLKPNTEISLKILAYNSDKIPKATAFAFGRSERNLLPLYEKGIVIVEIGEQEYALVYKGEKLIQGTPNDKKVLEFYKGIKKVSRSSEKLGTLLEETLISRKTLSLVDESLLGKTPEKGIKMVFDLMDGFENIIGQLIRNQEKSGKLVYSISINGKIEKLNCFTRLLDAKTAKVSRLPVFGEEKMLMGDFNIPKAFTDKYSGLGDLILSDAVAFYKTNKKFGKIDGVIGWWKKASMYEDYGGQSVNLKKFWEARKAGESIEKAALSTFTGSKMKKLGFGKVRYISKNISENEVIVNFLKE